MNDTKRTEENVTGARKDLLEQFKKETRLLEDRTAKTLQSYENAFQAYKKHGKYDESDNPPPLQERLVPDADFSEQGLKRFVMNALEDGMKPITLNTYARSINSFLSWLHINGHTEKHLKIPMLKVEKRVLKTYTSADFKRLLEYKPKFFGGKRVLAILHLMGDTGVRINEALTLTRENIDFDNLLITVYGKGRKERKIPISFECRKILFRWLKNHKFDLVFCTKHGGKVLYDNARKDLLRLLDFAEIEKSEGAFHAFRRYFGKHYLRNGGNVLYLQKTFGHASLEMTRAYVEADEEDWVFGNRRGMPQYIGVSESKSSQGAFPCLFRLSNC